MRRKSERFAWLGVIAPAVMFVLCAICTGFGLHSVSHLRNVEAAFAHDATCTKTLALSTPPFEGAVCRVVRGTIERAYVHDLGSNSGAIYQHHYVFAPQGGGALADVYLGDDLGSMLDAFQATEHHPGGAAIAEYVDGDIDYIGNERGTIGPVLDPEADSDQAWFFVAMGGFFGLLAVILCIVYFISRRSAVKRSAA